MSASPEFYTVIVHQFGRTEICYMYDEPICTPYLQTAKDYMKYLKENYGPENPSVEYKIYKLTPVTL